MSLFGFGMNRQLREAKATIASDPMAQARSRQQAGRAEEALARVAELELRVRILEGLLAQQLQLPAERLQAIIEAGVASARSARAAGSMPVDTVACPGCGRSVSRALAACQVCGAATAR